MFFTVQDDKVKLSPGATDDGVTVGVPLLTVRSIVGGSDKIVITPIEVRLGSDNETVTVTMPTDPGTMYVAVI